MRDFLTQYIKKVLTNYVKDPTTRATARTTATSSTQTDFNEDRDYSVDGTNSNVYTKRGSDDFPYEEQELYSENALYQNSGD